MLKYFLVKTASEDGLVKRQRNQRSNCQYLLDHWKSESSKETSTSALLTMLKPLTVWITTKCRKFFKRWEYQTTWPASWEICMQVKKQQLELDMEQQNGSKLGKEYIKAVYCHPDYLTYMQTTSWEMLAWMKHKLESILPGEISITSDMQMTSQFSSVAQLCPALCNLMDRSMPGLPVHHQLPKFTQTHVHWVGDAIQPSNPLSSPSLPASIFPSFRVFSNESVFLIRWPKYWSFSFNISPSNEYSGLIPHSWHKEKKNWRAFWWKWKRRVKKLV